VHTQPLEVPADTCHKYDFIATLAVGDFTGNKAGDDVVGHRQCYISMVHYTEGQCQW